MKEDRFRKLEDLFDKALNMTDEERLELIESIALSDRDTASRLQAMLRVDGDLHDPLRRAIETSSTLELPRRIGPFEVLGKLGEGGMGVVYLCRRNTEDFDQLLAVKRLSGAGDSELARQRLAIERRVLATLRHPNIAQLIDGGEDADGTPFVAMEYVDGVAIDQYVRDKGLDRSARVRLFLGLCQAVQFAHRHLIVHRDIKSANVLVDGNGQVKLLDFGIAKLLGDEHGGGDRTVLTVAGAMTPHYASPEQIRGESVTPLSDVYSLGVLLYELLADRRPYDITTRRPTEIERIICLTDPPPPLSGASGGRKGDLNAIVAKAMHKDIDRRYPSAAQLAEDLERWLDDRPIQARPDSKVYRARSFARRHPFGVAASSTLALLLLVFSVSMAWQAQRLALERDRAEREARVATETSDFLIELFRASDVRENNPEDLRARDLLDRAAARIPAELDSDPLLRAQLMQVIGLAYTHLALETEAIGLLTEALQVREQALGSDHALVAYSLNRLGNALRTFGRMKEAEPMLVRALQWRQASGQIDHDLADSWNNVGLLHQELGWSQRAEESLRQSISLHRQAGGAATAQAAAPLHNLALALRSQQRFEEGRAAALESIALKRRDYPSLASLANTLAVLANIERELGSLSAALDVSQESLTLREQVFGRDSPRIASGLVTHANILAGLDRAAEAEALYGEALALYDKAGSADSLPAAHLRLAFGLFLKNLGRTSEASDLLAQALADAEIHLPADAPQLVAFREALPQAASIP